MGKLCIIGFDDDKVIKDFIRLHVEGLEGEKVCLNHWFPDYRHEGRMIRHFYTRHPWRTRLRKLLPQFLYHRIVTRKELGEAALLDAFGGFFDAHGVDVILAEFGDTGAAIAPFAEKLGIPLIVHFHGHDAHRQPFLTPEMRARYREMFRVADAVLGVSKMMLEALVELGCPAEKLIWNPYGPRDAFFTIEPDYRPTILSLGRFTDIKANYLVLLAFREVLEKFPEAELVMAGNGELLETCRTLAEVTGIAHRVRFPGAVPHAGVPALFARACCFVQHSVTPSYGDAEGTPNTILEAQAAGLPVVATRHAGIPDVVVHGQTGYLVEECDVSAMAAGILTLLENPAGCRDMGSVAREHIRANFPSAKHLQRLQTAISRARESRQPR